MRRTFERSDGLLGCIVAQRARSVAKLPFGSKKPVKMIVEQITQPAIRTLCHTLAQIANGGTRRNPSRSLIGNPRSGDYG
jgi:hypothetical protein